MEPIAPPVKNIEIEMPAEISEGIYSNMAIVSQTQNEFVFDFIVQLPGMPKGIVKARIVVQPKHAKRILAALKANIEHFKKNFGEIESQEMPPISGLGPKALA